MAIHQNEDSFAAGAQPHPTGQNPGEQIKRPTIWSFAGGGAMLGAVMAKDVGSEIYNAFKKIMLEMAKAANATDNITKTYVIDFDNKNYPAMSFSSIIIATSVMTDHGLSVAYCPILLEATGKLDSTVDEYINGQNVRVNVTTSHAINARYTEAAAQAVRNAVPAAAVLRYTDAIVVNKTFEKENEIGIKQLMYQATLATNTKNIVVTPDFEDMNLPYTAKASGGNLVISTICNPAEVIVDAAGGMRRSDFEIQLKRETRGNGSNRSIIGNLNSPDATTAISKLNAFVDLEFSDPMATMGGMAHAYMTPQQMMMNQQKYFARIVVTDVQCSMAMTPAMVLLSIFLTSAMRDSYAYMRAFMPLKDRTSEASRRKIDIRDIGALNVEANLDGAVTGSIAGLPIDLFRDSEGNYRGAPSAQEVGVLLARFIRPQVALSIDIPRAAPTTSFLSLLRQASDDQWRTPIRYDQATGALQTSEAYQRLYEGFNTLTDGNWEKVFPMGKEMFTDVNNIQLDGTYTDLDGRLRPISEIDRIAVCSLFRDNPMQIRYWSDTFNDINVQIENRLSRRQAILKEAIPTLEVTGLIDRVTFKQEVWSAMDEAVKMCGVPFDMQSNFTSEDLGAPRVGPAWASQAVVGVGGGFARAGYSAYGNGHQGYYSAVPGTYR